METAQFWKMIGTHPELLRVLGFYDGMIDAIKDGSFWNDPTWVGRFLVTLERDTKNIEYKPFASLKSLQSALRLTMRNNGPRVLTEGTISYQIVWHKDGEHPYSRQSELTQTDALKLKTIHQHFAEQGKILDYIVKVTRIENTADPDLKTVVNQGDVPDMGNWSESYEIYVVEK